MSIEISICKYSIIKIEYINTDINIPSKTKQALRVAFAVCVGSHWKGS
jgi:hypothetical protein